MLEKQDLEMIRLIVREEVGESENRMKKHVCQEIGKSEERMTEKIAESEERMKMYIHEEIGHSENRVLAELDRVDIRLTFRMNQIENKMSEICDYYRIRRLDDTNASYILRLIDSLTRRVEMLEAKSA